MTVVTSNPVQVSVDAGGLRAVVTLSDPTAARGLSIETLLDSLSAANVRITPTVRLAVEEFLTCVRSGKWNRDGYVVATAEPAVEPIDGHVAFSVLPAASAGNFNDLIQQSAIIVQRNDVIGRIVPPAPSRAGANVLGQPIPPRRTSGEPVRLSKSVRLGDDGVSLIACRPGRCEFNRGVVSVNELTLVQRDIRPSVEKLDWLNDVIIRGDVRDAANLRSAESLIVVGTVKDASARAARCVIVHLGLIGSGKGRIEAGDDVAAKFYEDASANAGRDILIGSSAVNSNLAAMRDILAEGASIVGGVTQAGRSIHVSQLGSNRAIPTRIVLRSKPPAASDAGTKVPNDPGGLGENEQLLLRVESVIHVGTILEFGPLKAVFNDALTGAFDIRLHLDGRGPRLLASPRDGSSDQLIDAAPIEPAQNAPAAD